MILLYMRRLNNGDLLQRGMKQTTISKFFRPRKKIKVDRVSTATQRQEKVNAPIRTVSENRKLTPLENQIVDFKNQYDCILAIQVGYKYRFFGNDAVVVSQLVNIMLVPHEDARFQYCSIPDIRLHVHLKKLLEFGHTVGVIKQTQTSFEAKGLFERKLTGLYTKATYMNEELESPDLGESEKGEFLSAVCREQKRVAVVCVRPITGEVVVDEFDDNDLLLELDTRMTYFNPSLVILVDDYSPETLLKSYRCNIIKVKSTSETVNYDSLLDNEDSPLIQKCVGELCVYLKPFNLDNIFMIPSNISRFSDSNSMILPANVVKSLEIFENSTNHKETGSLFWLLNQTRTKFGERLLAKWISHPLVERSMISDRLEAIGDLTRGFNHFIDCLKDKMTQLMDLEQALIRVYYSKISRTNLYKMLKTFNDICTLIASFNNDINLLITNCKSKDLADIFTELRRYTKDLHIEHYLRMISTTYGDSNHKDQKLEYFNLKYHNWTEISDKLRDIETINLDITQELTSIIKVLGKPTVLIKNLNQDNLVEVRNALLNKIPDDWIRINSTKAITRFRSPTLHKLNNQLIHAKEQLEAICDKCFQEFIAMINNDYYKFHGLVKQLAKFDCYLSLTAVSFLYTKPEIVDDQIIDIGNFKNPIINNNVSTFITNSVRMDSTNRIAIITGPNMGGKSSYIKSIGLLIIMAQIGSYLPCEWAKIGIFDRIYIRTGAFDNILKGQSTFKVEMLEMYDILTNFTAKSLILLDEIGRGTGSHDGYVIAYSILRYFAQHDLKPLILFITHFPQLRELTQLEGVEDYHMDYLVEDDKVIFLFKLVKGMVNDLYGLNVARLAGISADIIRNAKHKSRELRLQNDLREFLFEMKQLKTEDLCLSPK